MVVFTCNHCGESLHKPKVEKHYQFQCRNYKSVTCVDCFKDFRDDEYVVHTKCVTEDERYAAKGTYKNGIVKKGEVKQESWLEMIRSICENETTLKPSIRNLLETISGYSNVPRKRIKFINFIKSSSGNRVNFNDIEEVWDIIEKYKNKKEPTNGQACKKHQEEQPTNGHTDKRPIDDQEIVTEQLNKKAKTVHEDTNSEEKFDIKGKILEVLEKKQTISLKKLQKKILKAYTSAAGGNNGEEKMLKKISKKLKKLPNVTVEEERVTLVSE